MSVDDIRKKLDEQVVVPLWPDAGTILELTRGQTYRSAKAGDIKVIRMGHLFRVPTAWLRKKVELDGAA